MPANLSVFFTLRKKNSSADCPVLRPMGRQLGTYAVQLSESFILKLAELVHLYVEFLTRFSLGLAEFADLLAGFSLKFTELVHLDVEFPARFSLGLAELVHLYVKLPARFSLRLAELVHLDVEFPARFSLGLAELVHLDVEFPARFSLRLAELVNSLENILYVEFLSHNKNIQNGEKYVKGIYLKFSMPSKSVGTSELKSELAVLSADTHRQVFDLHTALNKPLKTLT